MKKLYFIIAAALITCGAAFAKPSFNHDIQLHTGVGFDSASYKSAANNKVEATSTAFVIGAESWLFHDLNSMFSVGLMGGLDASIGGTSSFKINGTSYNIGNDTAAYHFNFIVGPAVSFKLNDVVHFNGMFGFSWMIDDSYWGNFAGTESALHFSGAGIAFDVQAKFLPTKQFSPLAGYRLTINWADRVTQETRSGTTITKVSDKQNNICTSTGVLYVGCAYNF